MKKKSILFLILTGVFLLGSCINKNEFPKPEKPIEKGVMVNILYDLTLLQALKSYSSMELEKNNINPKTYIYQKYKIDSAQFAQNNKYYASNIEEYKSMFEDVAARLKKQKTENDTLLNRENRVKARRISDSLQKFSAKKVSLSSLKAKAFFKPLPNIFYQFDK
jgi:hypothetical protein